MSQRQLEVVLNNQVIGVLKEVSDIWEFDYSPEWLQDPRSFDLSPAIGRYQQQHLDGSTMRPVQWYFDNLLPEEAGTSARPRRTRSITRYARIAGRCST